MWDEESNLRTTVLAGFIFFCVVVIWVVAPTIIAWIFPKMEDRAASGDMFGSISALFSGLAFAGIILSIHLQSRELSLQRQELRNTRAEMKRTADAQEEAERILKKQVYLSALSAVVASNTALGDSKLTRNQYDHMERAKQACKELEEVLAKAKDEVEESEVSGGV